MKLRAVTAEDGLLTQAVVDVAADAVDHGQRARHQADVDPTLVIAVHQHDVIVGATAASSEDLLVEPAERDAVLSFDHHDDVGVDLLQDAGRVLRRHFVDGFALELEPADPVGRPRQPASARRAPA